MSEELRQEIETLDTEAPGSIHAALQLAKRVMFQYASKHIREDCVCCVCNAKRMIAKIDEIGP